MARKDKQYSKRFIECWTGFIQRRPATIIIVILLATSAIFFYLIHNFTINTDLNSMISDKLHFRKVEEDFSRAFPQLSNAIVIVIDADSAERAVSARKSIVERLQKETGLFKTIYVPGGGEFFEQNGLLYLNTEELEELADKLANAQPLLAFLSRDLSLRGLFSVLGMALTNRELENAQKGSMNFLFDEMSRTFEGIVSAHPYQISWEAIMLGTKETSEQCRQFIILQPYVNIARLSAGEKSIETIRRIAKELDINEKIGVKMRVTGDIALSYENLMTVKNSTGIATVVSLVLVGIVFYIGLGSGRMVFASLLTLIIGLIWTTGFGIAFIGSLNLISITFAVLFIGLGIDYSIQFCLRYRELTWAGYDEFEGIRRTAKGVGRSLLLSCITVAIGFYSFLPTAYAGVAELGLISGTGMFVSFFATITVLPAILTLSRIKKIKGRPKRFGELASRLPYEHPKTIVVVALIFGLGSIPFLPKVFFDFNPLNLYSKTSVSAATIRELFRNNETAPWTISVLVKGRKNAQELAEKLKALKEVKRAITLFDFVPDKQPEKLGIISDIALFMPSNMGDVSIKHLSYEQGIRALNSFEKILENSLRLPPMNDNPSAKRLNESIKKFKALLKDPVKGEIAFTSLEESFLMNLPDLFKTIERSLKARLFSEDDLPPQLAKQYMSSDRRYRIQVFPSENILGIDALKRFVLAVQAVAPNATDTPVTIYEAGKAVVTSFRQATLYALTAITIFLLFELRSFSITILILIPLLLAMLLTGTVSVLLNIPLNFANVIVVPLLLGIGVHTGIMFMFRYLTEPPLDGNMLRTSTARAVFFSLLTTIISVSSLSFSPHRGIASMGVLLSICLSLLIICILFLLPALIKLSIGGHVTKKR